MDQTKKHKKRSEPLSIIQWNCRGFRNRHKKAHLRLYNETLEFPATVIALQEPGAQARITGFNTYQRDPSTCLLVHKSYTAQQIDLDLQIDYSYTMVTVLPLRRTDPSIHILNIYCPPKTKHVNFADLFSRALSIAGREPLLIVGDFNAPSKLWGYKREEARGRKLAELISTLGITLHTDPANPTRMGNSVNRDTCPDLTLTKNTQHVQWNNMGDTLGSDHCIINTLINTRPLKRPLTKARLPDWQAFRQSHFPANLLTQGFAAWANTLTTTLRKHEKLIQITEENPAVDNHLLHLWEARRGLTKRWKRQKHNRTLRKRIQEVTQQAAEYASHLADTNWVDRCNAAASQMSNKNTWRLFRSLIDPTQTRGETQRHLQRALHNFQGTTTQLAETLRDKYLSQQQDPRGPEYSYAGRDNPELDQHFQLHDLKAALAKMRRGTAPGRDRITVKLLANLPDPAYIHLLEYINAIWKGETPLPVDWKTALVTFIPKAGKSINTDNLRPISLTSCVGKLMETMVRDRLSEYLENKNTFADTMFGFRPQKSAQDILLQLHREVIQPVAMPHNDRVVLALDLKGAFDNVKHSAILEHLSETHCGNNTFNYIKDFLSDRTALIRIQNDEYGPYQMGTRGTPQGAVLSPLLFNIAMMHLPARLSEVEGVQHALYADDITLWATQGNLGHIEESLQTAAHMVESYAGHCGLQCTPTKSEFVHIRASPKDTTNITISLPSGPIPEAREIRILGLFIHNQLKVDTTLHKLRKIGDQVGRMVRRVSNKRGGLRSKDSVRLAHAFVTSRILYSVPYLYLRKHEEEKIEVIIRKMIKRALDLPVSTSNGRLLALGVVNTYRELKEAHLTNQYTRLAQTRSGRNLLAQLHIQHDVHIQERVRIPELWRRATIVHPLPTKMDKEDHNGRRQARAQALERYYSQKHGVYYVDIAGPNPRGWYTAAVVHEQRQIDGLSFRAPGTTQAEEVAIALAASDSQSKHIITDSRSACRNYEAGWVTPLAEKILRTCMRDTDPSPKHIVWTPGHQGVRGNEAADAAARALISRVPPNNPNDLEEELLLRFKEISEYYKDKHRMYPAPAKGLGKANERILYRLFTNTMLCPAILKHFDPMVTGTCHYCGEVADTFHMVWACQSNPALTPNPNPTREDWEAALLGCSDLQAQKALVQRARLAASTNGVPD